MSDPELHFAHANGLPSACYRKMLDALGERFEVAAVPALGIDPAYPVEPTFARLTAQVVDSIRARCRGPVVGVGHSLGAITTFLAAYEHPELFTDVVLLDPPIINGFAGLVFGVLKAIGGADAMTPAKKSLGRREHWPSREDAAASLRPKGLFRSFDQDCFDDYIAHGLADVEDGVRLLIPVATEVAIFRATPHAWSRYRDTLGVPGTVVLGATSEFMKIGGTTRFARRHGLLHDVVPGSHMVPLEHPLDTAATIARVLSAARRARSSSR